MMSLTGIKLEKVEPRTYGGCPKTLVYDLYNENQAEHNVLKTLRAQAPRKVGASL